jgi:hypothetical protein
VNTSNAAVNAAELVFKKDYWDRPAISPKGDDAPQTLHEAVGYALSNWEEADQEMADLFLIFTCEAGTQEVGRQVRNAVQRAYGSIISNSGRRSALEAAAEVYFQPWWDNKPVKQSLVGVLNAIGWASQRRDDIAHGIVSPFIRGVVRDLSGRIIKEEDFGCFLMPPEYKTDRTHAYIQDVAHPSGAMKARYCFTSKDIRQFGFQFLALRAAIQHYVSRVRKDKEGKIPEAMILSTIHSAPAFSLKVAQSQRACSQGSRQR